MAGFFSIIPEHTRSTAAWRFQGMLGCGSCQLSLDIHSALVTDHRKGHDTPSRCHRKVNHPLGSNVLVLNSALKMKDILKMKYFVFIYLNDRVTEMGRDRALPSTDSHCPDCYNGQLWAKPNPGARNSIWITHVCGSDPNTWAIISWFHRHTYKHLDWKQSSQDLKQPVI